MVAVRAEVKMIPSDNPGRMINRILKENAGKIFFIDGRNDCSYTYGELYGMCSSFRRKLGECSGKSPVDVAVILRDQSSYMPVLLACWSTGRIPSIIDPNAASEKFETLNSLIKFKSIITDFDLAPGYSRLPAHRYVHEIPSGANKAAAIEIKLHRRSPFVILFTSGSTGIPKCVPLSLENITSNTRAFSNRLGINGTDCFLCTSPPWYAHGLYNSLLSSFFLGAKTLSPGILNVMNCGLSLDKSGKYGANIYHLMPSMLKILTMVGRKISSGLPEFKHVICGTARLEKKDKEDFESLFGIPVTQQYGMTETLFMCVNDRGQDKYSESVGRPVGCKLKIVGAGGKTLGKNETGEVICRSDSMYGSYYYQEEETAASYAGGWFHTGDSGFFNDENYLFITGRLKEIIKKGGVNVNPNEIDGVLLKSPLLKQAKTIGIPDSTYGEEIVSFAVKASKGATEAKLISLCRKNLPATHVPKRIFLIDEMPLTSTGKVSSSSLASLAKSKGE
ncbi:MAG: class I adenylate-forming enzyme family protein [Victivallales bacterium]